MIILIWYMLKSQHIESKSPGSETISSQKHIICTVPPAYHIACERH